MSIVTIGKMIINLLRGRGYKTVYAVAPVDNYTPIQPKSQEEAPPKPIRIPLHEQEILRLDILQEKAILPQPVSVLIRAVLEGKRLF